MSFNIFSDSSSSISNQSDSNYKSLVKKRKATMIREEEDENICEIKNICGYATIKPDLDPVLVTLVQSKANGKSKEEKSSDARNDHNDVQLQLNDSAHKTVDDSTSSLKGDPSQSEYDSLKATVKQEYYSTDTSMHNLVFSNSLTVLSDRKYQPCVFLIDCCELSRSPNEIEDCKICSKNRTDEVIRAMRIPLPHDGYLKVEVEDQDDLEENCVDYESKIAELPVLKTDSTSSSSSRTCGEENCVDYESKIAELPVLKTDSTSSSRRTCGEENSSSSTLDKKLSCKTDVLSEHFSMSGTFDQFATKGTKEEGISQGEKSNGIMIHECEKTKSVQDFFNFQKEFISYISNRREVR